MVADTLVWWGLLVLLGAAVGPLASLVLARFPDRGIGVAKPLALVLLCYGSWLATSLGVPHRASLIAATLLLGAAGALTAKRFGGSIDRREWLVHEGLFLGALALFAGLRSLDPAIFGAEKYMDFAFLNTLVRAEHFPPEDPWLSGVPINYYYFGYLSFANLTRLTGIAPEVGYNLSLATVGAVLFTGAASIARALGGTMRHGLAAGAAVTLLGNLDGALQLWAEGKGIAEFDYWRSTRVVPHTINEFPFFSLLHGDLHPHLTAFLVNVPLTALAIAWGGRPDGTERPLLRPLPLALIAVLLAALALTNPWDLPVYFTLLGLLAVHRTWDGAQPLRGLVHAGVALAVCGVAMVLLSLPFSLRFQAQLHGIGRVHESTPLGPFLTVFGLLIAPPLALGAAGAARAAAEEPETRDLFLAAGAFATIALYVATGNAVMILTAALLVGAISALLGAYRDSPLAPAIAVLGTAAAALFACEVVYLRDPYGAELHRMNTVFKLYFQSWWLLGLVFPVFAGEALGGVSPRPRLALSAALAVGVAASLCYPIALTTLRLRDTRGPSLDGLAYLDREHPGDAVVIRWLARNVPDRPVVLEATGDPYSYFARASANTGLPTVLGWGNHEGVWRGSDPRLEERRQDVERIYREPDVESVKPLLERYAVRYVLVGDLEREHYPGPGLDKFASHPELFTSVLRAGASELYEFHGSAAQR